MLSVRAESVGYNILIWVFYVPAQLLIILCNTDDTGCGKGYNKKSPSSVGGG